MNLTSNPMFFLLFHLSFQEESYGHALQFGTKLQRGEAIAEKRRLKKLKPNIYIEDRLGHLRYNDVWD